MGSITFAMVQKGAHHHFILMQQRVAVWLRLLSHLPLRLLYDTDRCLKAFRAGRAAGKIAAKGLTNDGLSVHKVLISWATWTQGIKGERIINARTWYCFLSSHFPWPLVKTWLCFGKGGSTVLAFSGAPFSPDPLSLPGECHAGPIRSEMVWGEAGVHLNFNNSFAHFLVPPQTQIFV